MIIFKVNSLWLSWLFADKKTALAEIIKRKETKMAELDKRVKELKIELFKLNEK